ncbi:hypothetical protein CKA32_000706 [Geitlerinema sp. FC II]|nr:hypothetical protein CKA32_000706 [Geitlerinema sp. FC II]
MRVEIHVSIPRRDFWVFQLGSCLREAWQKNQFQSLEGIFGFFNGVCRIAATGLNLFQSLEGIFGFFNRRR